MNLIVENGTSVVLVCTVDPVTEVDGMYQINGVNAGIPAATASLVVADTSPSFFYPQVYTYIDGVWTIVDQQLYDDMYSEYKHAYNAEQSKKRHAAYVAESDPIFFKSQRGEATQQQWLDAISLIDARYPYIT